MHHTLNIVASQRHLELYESFSSEENFNYQLANIVVGAKWPGLFTHIIVMHLDVLERDMFCLRSGRR